MRNPLELIGQPQRMRIMQLVWNEERSAGNLAGRFRITFGAVSQHLKVLRDADLIILRKVGRQRFYRARKERLGPLAAALEAMWAQQLTKLKQLAEEEASKKGIGGEKRHAGARHRAEH